MTKTQRRYNFTTNSSQLFKCHALSEDTIRKLHANEYEIIAPRSATLRDQDVTTILTALAERFKTDQDTVKIVLAVFFQQGGTARSCDGNTVITLNQIEYKLSAVRAVLKDCRFPRTEKKLARSLCDDIHIICSTLNLPGNLANKIRTNNPEVYLTGADEIWLSDFQAHNDKTPANLRKLITESFNTRTNRTKKSR